MKNVLKFVLLALFVAGAGTVTAQQVKLGYLNSQEIFQLMPERDSAMNKLTALQAELVEQLELLEVEYNQKMNDLQKNMSTYSESRLAMIQKDLNDLRTRLEEQSGLADQELSNQQQVLMTPIIEKLNAAIKKVSKSNGLTAVFDTVGGAMIYHDESTMTDMTPLVKKELGIQ